MMAEFTAVSTLPYERDSRVGKRGSAPAIGSKLDTSLNTFSDSWAMEQKATTSESRSLPRIKVHRSFANKQLEAAKESEYTYAVSPSTPLLSTAIDENSLCCGQNNKGQLGVGGTADVLEPQVLQVVRRWAAISIGEGHSAGVSGEGECYTWGQNEYGQLGWAAGEPKDVPMKMDILRGWDVRAISCGAAHTVAITPDDVISWGCNGDGQTGQGERAETGWVKPRSLKPLQGLFVTQVVCGRAHTLCVTATSQVFAWGNNTLGQLGLNDTINRRAPAPLEALWAIPVAQLAAGEAHSAALTINGFLFTWGSNEKGQLGMSAGADAASQAQKSASEKQRDRRKVNQRFLTAMVEMGIPLERAEVALSETGNVGIEVAAEWYYSVPENTLEKLLGNEPNTPTNEAEQSDDPRRSLVPRRVPLQAVRAIAAGGQHTVAVTETSVHSWGSNSCGQLGTRTFRDKSIPTEVKDLRGKGVVQVACGLEHTLFLCREGSVYGCGSTQHGQLPYLKFSSPEGSFPDGSDSGDEHRVPRNEITQVTRLKLPILQERGGRGPVVSAVAAGGNSSAFLTRASDEFPEPPGPQLWQRLQTAIAAASEEATTVAASKLLKPLMMAVDMVFGSAAALSATFGSKEAVGIDVELLNDIQERVLEVYRRRAQECPDPQQESSFHLCASSLETALYKATNRLLDDLSRNHRLLGTPERAQVVLAAVQSPLLRDRKRASLLIPRLCNIILTAPNSCRQILVKWWSEYPAELLQTRVVEPLQQYLTDELSTTKKLTVSVMNSIKVLAKVEEANQIGRQLPPEAFYNDLISEKLDVEDHYVAWRQAHDAPQHCFGTEGPFSFCSYPFLLSPRAKSKLLHTEARFLMTQTVNQSRAEYSSPNQRRPNALDERVLPDLKASIRIADAEAKARGKYKNPGIPRSQDPRRQSRSNGLRTFWQNVWRNGEPARSGPNSPMAPDLPVDERRMLSREVTNSRSHPSSPSEATQASSRGDGSGGAAFALARQGSMNLPPPDESGVPATHPDMCILRIRRNHLVEDALDEVARQRPRDLYKPLRVHFIGEDGIDAGGVKKEFFQLLVTELLCPDYGMLVFMQESRTYWFNAASIGTDDEFMLMGLVLGLAIYNAVLLDFPLPQALYRKLLGQSCTLRDLSDMDPTLGRSLGQLLAYDAEEPVELALCQTFTASQQGVGEVVTVALCEGGEERMVTEENRREYVELYINHVLNSSVHRQFEAFARGFMMLCGGPAMHLFSATELERLVCGNPILDFSALQQNARYEGGFSADHRTIKWLWEVVHEFSQEEQRHFLKFFTGSDRAPIGGLGNQRCIVQRDGAHSEKLPRSHTCFNTLLLPSYKSKGVLIDRLRLAIMNSEGFGLE